MGAFIGDEEIAFAIVGEGGGAEEAGGVSGPAVAGSSPMPAAAPAASVILLDGSTR